jgi:hypothetical protein
VATYLRTHHVLGGVEFVSSADTELAVDAIEVGVDRALREE